MGHRVKSMEYNKLGDIFWTIKNYKFYEWIPI